MKNHSSPSRLPKCELAGSVSMTYLMPWPTRPVPPVTRTRTDIVGSALGVRESARGYRWRKRGREGAWMGKKVRASRIRDHQIPTMGACRAYLSHIALRPGVLTISTAHVPTRPSLRLAFAALQTLFLFARPEACARSTGPVVASAQLVRRRSRRH